MSLNRLSFRQNTRSSFQFLQLLVLEYLGFCTSSSTERLFLVSKNYALSMEKYLQSLTFLRHFIFWKTPITVDIGNWWSEKLLITICLVMYCSSRPSNWRNLSWSQCVYKNNDDYKSQFVVLFLVFHWILTTVYNLRFTICGLLFIVYCLLLCMFFCL